MPNKVLVVGANSFIATNWKLISPETVTAISHSEMTAKNLADFDVIVNCAISHEAKRSAYREAEDFDLFAARRSADSGKHFIMLSTRKVYRQSSQTSFLDEASLLEPSDYYSANKLESENRIQRLMGNRCTILRIANVYGYEIGRRSFFGMAMTRLKEEQRIVLDVSPFIERDFIAVEALSKLLNLISNICPPGIFNLGSGIGLPLGRVAQWLIQGYGRGRLDVTDVADRDAFIMNIAKLRQALSVSEVPNQFEHHIKNLGRKLVDE